MTVKTNQHVRVHGRRGVFRFLGWDAHGNAKLFDCFKEHLAAARAGDIGILCARCQTQVDEVGRPRRECADCDALIGKIEAA